MVKEYRKVFISRVPDAAIGGVMLIGSFLEQRGQTVA
jgi:hypothetical protein